MRSRLPYLLVLAPLVSVAACTSILGDFSVGGGGGGDDDTTGDGGNLDGTIGDGASNKDGSPITDGAPNGDAADAADAAPGCGYTNEACCTGPFSACQPGAACVSDKCRVSDMWAVGNYGVFADNGAAIHYDGTSWTRGPDYPVSTKSGGESSPYSNAVWGFGPNAFKLVTTGGYLVTYQAGPPTLWRNCGDAPCPSITGNQELWSIYGFSEDDYWVEGSSVMYHCSSASCVSTTTGMTGTWGTAQFTGPSSSDLWFPDFDHAFHYDGTSWHSVTGISARAMWAHSATDVWSGDSQLQHWDGVSWSPLYNVTSPDAGPGRYIDTITGTATDDVWAAGSNGSLPLMLHWNGTAWSNVAIAASAASIQQIVAAARDEAFAVAKDGIYKWNGTNWTVMTVPMNFDAGFGVDTANWQSIATAAHPRP